MTTGLLASVDVKRILRGRIYGKLLRLGASYRQSVATSEVVQMAGEGEEGVNKGGVGKLGKTISQAKG